MGSGTANKKRARGASEINCKILLRSFFFLLDFLAAGHEFLFAALVAACGACGACNHINDDLAAVLSAGCTGAVRQTESSAFAAGGTDSGESVVAPALPCLRAVYPHSDYHMAASIRISRENAKKRPRYTRSLLEARKWLSYGIMEEM